MSDQKIVESFYWHDGLLFKFQYSIIGAAKILLEGKFYESSAALERSEVELEFWGVENLCFSADSYELIDNQISGNISDAYVKPCSEKGRYKCTIYFVDGYLSFSFNKVILKRNG